MLTTALRTTTVRYAVPVHEAFTYLADPRNRPEWQSSLRRAGRILEKRAA